MTGSFAAFDEHMKAVIMFVQANQVWAAPIVGALAFGESLVFLSLLLPATLALVGIGALIGVSGISFVPIWLAAAIGASLGDWLSFWLGVKFKGPIAHVWPLSRYPFLMPRGHAFVEKWGIYAVFIGRFFGPLRASVPLAAGILDMPWWPFQIANVTSALLWAALLLAPGALGMKLMLW
ncbi:MAG: DedA family protein [Proteobacteria bacterium]|nr:DedA family protein [Pseudomonadota bacterium]